MSGTKKPEITIYDGFIRLKIDGGRGRSPPRCAFHDLKTKEAEELIEKLTEAVNLLKVKKVMES
jgi:hypothetical protein